MSVTKHQKNKSGVQTAHIFLRKKRMLKNIRIESKTSSWIFLKFLLSGNMNDSIMGVLFTKYTLLVNPLSPSIHTQILQPDIHTFPLRINWENLIVDQSIFSLVIILLVLITFSLDLLWILLGENWCWSPLGLMDFLVFSVPPSVFFNTI